eukprot:446160-Prorocentrum_minimum.AAC.2
MCRPHQSTQESRSLFLKWEQTANVSDETIEASLDVLLAPICANSPALRVNSPDTACEFACFACECLCPACEFACFACECLCPACKFA